MTYARIVSTGIGLPDRILTNDEIAQTLDTSDAWIHTRTGIHQRRVAGPGEATSDFAAKAGLQALERAGLDPMDLEAIIVATVTPDYHMPSAACLTQVKMGALKAMAFDVSAACTGYIYALSVADAYIRAGVYKNVLVIGADLFSTILNWEDRGSCVLFGDGAGATLVTASDRPGVRYMELGADGNHAKLIHVPAGGSMNPTTSETAAAKLQYTVLDGREVYKLAVRYALELIENTLKKNNMTVADIDLLIPHQANQRITDAVQERIGIPREKVYSNIEFYGNTSAATIPICLHEALEKGMVKEGGRILTVAFGAGFTWGAALIDW